MEPTRPKGHLATVLILEHEDNCAKYWADMKRREVMLSDMHGPGPTLDRTYELRFVKVESKALADEIDDAVASFLAAGGTIQLC